MKVSLVTYLSYINNCEESELKDMISYVLEYYIERIDPYVCPLCQWEELAYYLDFKHESFIDCKQAKEQILIYLQENEQSGIL